MRAEPIPSARPPPELEGRGVLGVTNADAGTRIDEIAAGIYRISTPVPETDFPGGFSFNQ